MSDPADTLTPDAFRLLHAIAQAGSFAGAARALGLVPSALTYRVRQIEDALDVLLFDRSHRQARPTPAGLELLAQGARLRQEVDALVRRVQRVATGWESELTIAVDGVISQAVLLDLCCDFYALNPPTRLRLRTEILSGTLGTLRFDQERLNELHVCLQGQSGFERRLSGPELLTLRGSKVSYLSLLIVKNPHRVRGERIKGCLKKSGPPPLETTP